MMIKNVWLLLVTLAFFGCQSIEKNMAKHPLFDHLSCRGNVSPHGYRSVVFVDGIFDLPHYGHQGFIERARNKAAEILKIPSHEIFLLVGISGTPNEIKQYKRASVFSYDEKRRTLCGFADVNGVINSPMRTTEDFLKAHKIDLVIAGNDYEDVDKAKRYYEIPLRLNKFVTVERTLGISTSDIMRRVVTRVGEVLDGRATKDEDREVIREFMKLVDKEF